MESVETLTQCEIDHVWRDRFGWRVWWDNDKQWWVTQSSSGAGSDKPRAADDLERRGPFVAIG